MILQLERSDNISKNNKNDTKNTLRLTIPIPPSINNDYMKPRGILKCKGGKPFAMAMMYEDAKAKKYKKDIVKLIKQEVEAQGFIKQDGRFTEVAYTFFFPRINMDTNNYYKCFIDAITESQHIWVDDNVSLMRDNRIYYDTQNPRVEVTITYMDYIGIFDDSHDLNLFIKYNCSSCSRGKNIGVKGGCSIYKKALESRIQEELNIDFESGVKLCLKKK